jgi:predicted small lipoprotein YifL
MRLLLVLLALLGLAYLGACGYKGALYLPESKTGPRKPPTIVHPEPAPDRPMSTPAEAAPAPK